MTDPLARFYDESVDAKLRGLREERDLRIVELEVTRNVERKELLRAEVRAINAELARLAGEGWVQSLEP